MTIRKTLLAFIVYALSFIALPQTCIAQSVGIKNDKAKKTISIVNQKMQLLIDYNKKINISSFILNGQKIIQGFAGIYSEVKTNTRSYSSLSLLSDPLITILKDSILITRIDYNDANLTIHESWGFKINASEIKWTIDRTLSHPLEIEDIASPVFQFSNINTWTGAYQDYGGIAWFYLFNKKLDTYGVHSKSSRFWNSTTNNGLTISVASPGNEVAMNYSRSNSDQLAYRIGISPNEMIPRFDSGTQRRRFIRDRTDIWSSFKTSNTKSTQTITLSFFNFNEQFGRGNLVGINGKEVSAVLNTIARIGVIDKEHFGGNSWHTPYGPICLHEQYIAQMGLAINDSEYLKGYQQCLDFYRDNAVRPDGHVWARWAYSNEDMMADQVTDKGFYEAQWGFLIDANPDFVSNVSDLYDQTGDLVWVKTHQESCEKALNWILKRDSNNNGLVEVMTDNHSQRKGSDWIDIIWASFENAFVNAKLYHALMLWANIEKQLNNTNMASKYLQFAEKLKANFNKPTPEGGFWDAGKNCYVHWRDKDGSIHGSNMVTPVNFMAIAYGICDDSSRTKLILDQIETQMQKEHLFFWPICMTTYGPGEGNDWQFPFPNYENGDLFLSWGSIGVKAYASYKPELAIKYIEKVLAQYAKDGLAFQRYGRAKQDGRGDDILSGNSLAVVGLYQSVYGINPLYNRLYLSPHITQKLSGTELIYKFRGQQLKIGLTINRYTVSNSQFKIISAHDFGFFANDKELHYFNKDNEKATMKVLAKNTNSLVVDIKSCATDRISWTQSSGDKSSNKITYELDNLQPNQSFIVRINNKVFANLKSNSQGTLMFDYKTTRSMDKIIVSR